MFDESSVYAEEAARRKDKVIAELTKQLETLKEDAGLYQKLEEDNLKELIKLREEAESNKIKIKILETSLSNEREYHQYHWEQLKELKNQEVLVSKQWETIELLRQALVNERNEKNLYDIIANLSEEVKSLNKKKFIRRKKHGSR